MLVLPTLGSRPWVLPFDELYGFAHVFHKPALGSSFALRNLLKEKTFLFWDDFRPVEYDQRTVPVITFLSLFQGQPFEVQMSQAFNDGNADRGCVLTGKAKDLWKPLPGVDEEGHQTYEKQAVDFHLHRNHLGSAGNISLRHMLQQVDS